MKFNEKMMTPDEDFGGTMNLDNLDRDLLPKRKKTCYERLFVPFESE